MDNSDPIDRVREARRRISNAQANDTQKLLSYYEALQEQYRHRLVRVSRAVDVPAEQAAAADGASRSG